MYHNEEIAYLDLLRDILYHGADVANKRTNKSTFSIFCHQLEFDITGHRVPIVTTRKVNPMTPLIEMLWFMSGNTDIEFLKKYNVNIWDSWVIKGTERYDEKNKLIGGSIGAAAYGSQWRRWEAFENGQVHCIDQLKQVIETLKTDPSSRRMLVSAWNPARLHECALPPCHESFQLYSASLSHFEYNEMIDHYEKSVQEVDRDAHRYMQDDEWHDFPTRSLQLRLRMRSSDAPVGLVFNIHQYACLAHMIAQVTNTWATKLIWQGGDVHIYDDQIEGVRAQLERNPIDSKPTLHFNRHITDIDDFKPEDFTFSGYESHPFIKYPVAV